MGSKAWLLALTGLPLVGAGLAAGTLFLLPTEASGLTGVMLLYAVPLTVPVALAALVARRRLTRVAQRVALCGGTLLIAIVFIATTLLSLVFLAPDSGAPSACPDGRVYC